MKNMKPLYFLLTLLVIAYSKTTVHAAEFKDVHEHDEYFDAVQLLWTTGIAKGYNGYYEPHRPVTRAHVAKMMTEVQSVYSMYPTRYDQTMFYYKDVSLRDWYYPYIAKVKASSIMVGYEAEQLFKPNRALTRAQAAKVIVETFNIPPVQEVAPFEDVPANAYYRHYVDTLYAHRIVRGNELQQFRPERTITRAQWAMMIERAVRWYEREGEKKSGQPLYQHPNLLTYEHYVDVQRAWAMYRPTLMESAYAVSPLYRKPFRVGQLTERSMQEALQAVQFIRVVAKLPANQRVSTAYSEEAQAAAFLLSLHDQGLSHTPAMYAGMPTAMYQKAYNGAATSNLAVGYSTVASSILFGYMMDEDEVNREDVGHRLWILNPSLRDVGFGYARSLSGRYFSAMKVVGDGRHDSLHIPFIAWPSEGAFPSNLFTPFSHRQDPLPWSVTLSRNIYEQPKFDKVRVTLTRYNDGKVWTFSKHNHTDGFFTMHNLAYGMDGTTIIFQPNRRSIPLVKGDNVFRVKIEGLHLKGGRSTTIEYNTTIFDL